MEVRTAVRAIVLDADDRVLLHQVQERERGLLWLTPGGGLEPGEEPLEGLRRELWEETGLRDPEIGPQLWFRHHVFRWNGNDVDQSERCWLVRVDRHEPLWQDETDETTWFRGHRWWTREELLEATGETFVPRRLPQLIDQLLAEGPPAEPFDCGV